MEANREVTSGVQKTLCNDDATNGSDLLPSIPSQPQLPQTHGWIAEEANESSQPQSPHEENEKSSKDLEETTTRVTITPINRLPFEILGLIFMIHVWGHDRTPWILAHVSRTWRAAAFMTKTLWTCILVAPPNWKLLASSRRDLSRQEVCYKTGQFNRALSRADGAPLDLKVIDFLQTLGNRRSSAETRTRKDFPSINDMSPGKKLGEGSSASLERRYERLQNQIRRREIYVLHPRLSHAPWRATKIDRQGRSGNPGHADIECAINDHAKAE